MGDQAQNFLPEVTGQDGPQAGPSWANARWPLLGAEFEDDLTQALDPTAMKLAVKEASAKAGKPVDEAQWRSVSAEGRRPIQLYDLRPGQSAD